MESQFGEKLARLFGQLSKQQSVPHHFDDTFFDKLIDYLPSDEQTNAAIAAFVSQVTTADSCNLLVVRLCLRLCGNFVQKNSAIIAQLPLDELLIRSQSVMHHDPGVREAFFNTSTYLLSARQRLDDPTTKLAIKSLRDPGESVFVRKSAQQYLSAHLTVADDQTTLSALFDLLMQLPESAVLLNSAAAAVVEGNVLVPQQLCESFVRIARTRRRAVGDAYWRLTASAFSRTNLDEGLQLLRDASGWANEQGRLAVIKHLLLLSQSNAGAVSQTTIDLLLDAAPSSSAIFHLTEVISVLPRHQLIYVVNNLIGKLGTVEKVPVVVGLTKFVSHLPAFVFVDNDVDFVSMFTLVRRHCWVAPDLLRVIIELTPSERISASLLEIDSLIGIAVTKLDDSEWEVRDSALEVLLQVSEAYRKSSCTTAIPTALTAIVSKAITVALDDPSHFARASAVRLLESVDPAQALITALQVATEDSDPLPRRAAVQLMRSQSVRSETASFIAAILPQLALDTDVEVLVATIELCALFVEHDCETDKAVAFLTAMMKDTDVNVTALNVLKKLTDDGRLSTEMLLTIDEAELFRQRDFNRDHYAVQPNSLLDDMFAALCKDDSVDDDENMKDCY